MRASGDRRPGPGASDASARAWARRKTGCVCVLGCAEHDGTSARPRGSPAGLELLCAVEHPKRDVYQPFWATKGYLLGDLGRPVEARAAYKRALGLTEDPAVRAF